LVEYLIKNGILQISQQLLPHLSSQSGTPAFLMCIKTILDRSLDSVSASLGIPFLQELLQLGRRENNIGVHFYCSEIYLHQIDKYPSLLESSELSSLFVSLLIQLFRNKPSSSSDHLRILRIILAILNHSFIYSLSSSLSTPLVQLFHKEGMVDFFLSLSSSSDPLIAAYSIMILIVLHYKREWVERDIFINRLLESSNPVDADTNEDIQVVLTFPHQSVGVDVWEVEIQNE
jgi:hypothetical protein